VLTAVRAWQETLSREIAARFGAELAPAAVPFTFPPKPALGDASTPVAFALAKTLRRPPQAVAQELASVALEGVREIRVAGGYLNLFVDRAWALDRLLTGGFVPASVPGKVVVEHTNINPNKAAHVGHLRNAVLGDTLVRCLRATGRRVEVQNYIDDTGVQVADVVVGFQRVLEPAFGLQEVRALRDLFRAFEEEHVYDIPPELKDMCPAEGTLERTNWEQARGTRRGLGRPRHFASAQERFDEWNLSMEYLSKEFSLSSKIPPSDLAHLAHRCYWHSGGRFDFFCWELYARVAPWYERHDETKSARLETLHRMEAGDNDTAAMAALIAGEMVRCHLRTMERLGVRYDVLPHESDILKIGFWAACFEKLKASGAVHRVPDDSPEKNRGCWVMALQESDEFAGLSDADKVIVRSNGTVTYIGKDMAYQLWKFGLLGRDFHYRRFEAGIPGYPALYRTDASASDPGAPSCGAGQEVINVIDVRQSYLQKIVKEGLRQMGHVSESDRSVHFAYEMVALSTRFVREEMEKGARFELSEEDLAKPFVEMSGRKGLGYRADDLLDRLEDRAAGEIQKRDLELAAAEVAARARALATAALRYYMVKYNKNQIVAFDLEQAMAFEGETGPYLQYACVRAEAILRKAAEQGVTVPDPASPGALGAHVPHLDEEAWAVLTQFLRVPCVVEQACGALDLNLVARQLYVAAQAFHAYYHAFPVLQEPDEERRRARLLTVALFARLLRDNLDRLLGVPVPERM